MTRKRSAARRPRLVQTCTAWRAAAGPDFAAIGRNLLFGQ
jgi:hypothetical protein